MHGATETEGPRIAGIDTEEGGAVAEWVRALDWRPDGQWFESHIGKLFASELWQFRLPMLCQCLSEETLKAVGHFYLMSMPGEVKDPTSLHWNV